MKTVERFKESLEKNNLKYSYDKDEKENELIQITIGGSNVNGLSFLIRFYENKVLVNINCIGICKVPDGKRCIVLETLNELNRRYYWPSFNIDKNNNVCADATLRVSEDLEEDIVMDVFGTIINGIDNAYSIIMKAIWSE